MGYVLFISSFTAYPVRGVQGLPVSVADLYQDAKMILIFDKGTRPGTYAPRISIAEALRAHQAEAYVQYHSTLHERNASRHASEGTRQAEEHAASFKAVSRPETELGINNVGRTAR